jgi:hypothetical protein
MHDPLTGLFNRRYPEETLVREIHRCRHNEAPLGVIMPDLDHCKRYNDPPLAMKSATVYWKPWGIFANPGAAGGCFLPLWRKRIHLDYA